MGTVERKRVDPKSVANYNSLKEFYKANYDEKFYEFEDIELEIDPRETVEDFEEYSADRKNEEIIKCSQSFNYFCHKYVKITHPTDGLLSFITFKYQRSTIENYNDHRFNIIRKFRQGGLTTLSTIWALWRCLFKEHETLFFVSRTDREAKAAGTIARKALDELPSWMKPTMKKSNEHENVFGHSSCNLYFYTIKAVRGKSITYLFIDEAAFIDNMDKYWADLYPTLSGGGKCTIISTVNGMGGTGEWYYQTYIGAERKENKFNIIRLHYTDHPDYNNKEWVENNRAQLGEDKWAQEIIGDFLSSGSSFIPLGIIVDIEEEVRNIDPLHAHFHDFANEIGKGKDRGALYIWKEPVPGRNYIMGVDTAEGIGKDGDNSCFEIIDEITCEQVAEFYSNRCPMLNFATIVAQTGTIYNNALIVVEDEKCGNTVLSKLNSELYYPNLYYDNGKDKPGLHTNKSNKPIYMEILQTRLLNKGVVIRGMRFLHELKHFIYNKSTKKVEIAKGHHDDAIMALCLALYAREMQGGFAPSNQLSVQNESIEKFKIDVFKSIKEELMKEIDFDPLENDPYQLTIEEAPDEYEGNLPVYMQGKVLRKRHKILSEFGW